MNPAVAIRALLAGRTADVTAFLSAISLVGVLTMALIQAAKDATPIRDWFQRMSVRRWLERNARDAEPTFASVIANPAIVWHGATPTLDVDAAERLLADITVNSERNALYDLTTDQMSDQITTAVHMVVEYPTRYGPLLLILGARADPADIVMLLLHDSDPLLEAPAPAPAPPAASTPPAPHLTFTDARNRVSHQVQCAIDGFRIATSYRWKWLLQIASFLISAILAAAALLVSGPISDSGATGFIVDVAAISILAGFLAPVARDLTAALQKLRAT